MKVIQVQLSPSPAQITLFNRQLEEHRLLYNHCLEVKKSAYEKDKTNITCFDLIKSEIKVLKEKRVVSLSNISSLQQTIRRLDNSYQNFFKRGGFPRFKPVGRFNTIQYGVRGDGNQIRGSRFYLQRIGEVKCLWFREVKDYKTVSVTRRGDKFYANFIVESDLEKPNVTNKSVGLDFGCRTFLTTSDGEKIESPKFHKKGLKNEAKVARRVSKAAKGSRSWKKHCRTLRKIKSKIANRRKDFNHKLSRKFVKENDVVVIEDIKLGGLLSGKAKAINRTYYDLAFRQFREFLAYKVENTGKVLVVVDPANTTRECHCCGRLVDKSLNERKHVCACGCIEDRDVNAAKNILRRGLASLGESPRSPRIYSGE